MLYVKLHTRCKLIFLFLNTSVVVCLFPCSLICYSKRAVTLSFVRPCKTALTTTTDISTWLQSPYINLLLLVFGGEAIRGCLDQVWPPKILASGSATCEVDFPSRKTLNTEGRILERCLTKLWLKLKLYLAN